MAKITINNNEYEAKDGAVLLSELNRLGFDVPFYCFHEKLSIAANCRMCLVEIEGSPKLMPACQLNVQNGMKIKTDSTPVKDARRSVMEFLLLNHPLDCPVCDQAGECYLQDYYQEHALYHPRVTPQMKVRMQKAIRLGSMVYLDRERCIKCGRCVRFMEEVAKSPQLELVERSDHTRIEVKESGSLEHPYSGNVFEICPVGALTSSDFRFKMRVWWLKSVPSVCTGCSRGCNIFLDYNRNRVYRYRTRRNDAVNQTWLCDEGRLSYKEINQAQTLAPKIHGEPCSFTKALQEAVSLLKPYTSKKEESKVLLAVSAGITNEEVYLIGLICRDLFNSNRAVLLGKPAGTEDAFLRRADKNPNKKGAEVILNSLGFSLISTEDAKKLAAVNAFEAVLVFGSRFENNTATSLIASLKASVIFAPYESELVEKAQVVLPVSTFAETDGTFTNFEGRVQLIRKAFEPKGERKEGIYALKAFAKNFNYGLTFSDNMAIFDEIGRRVPAFASITIENLRDGTAKIAPSQQ